MNDDIRNFDDGPTVPHDRDEVLAAELALGLLDPDETRAADERQRRDALMLTDENGMMATVTIPDVRQSNGVIHVLDTVLMPKM